MSPPIFFLGLFIFALLGVGIRYLILNEMEDNSKKVVPPAHIVVQESGEILRSGERYTPGRELTIALGPRLVHATHEAGKHGVTEYLYLQATYAADEANLQQFVRAYREAGSYDKLDAAVTYAISGKLCLSRESDFSDLNFSNIENAYGIRILTTEGKPPGSNREKERLTSFERHIQTEMAKLKTLREAREWLGREKQKAATETDPELREFMLDVLNEMEGRLKTSL